MNEPLERGDEAELCDVVLRHWRDKIHGVDLQIEGNNLRRYDEKTGTWPLLSDDELKSFVLDYAGAMVRKGETAKPLRVSAAFTKGVLSSVKIRVRSRRPKFFDQPPVGVTFSNGFAAATPNGIALTEFHPEQASLWAHPFDYKANQTPQRLLDFLGNLWSNFSEEEISERTWLVQEFAGACLVGRATDHQKCLLLYGSGGNGKSQLVEALFRSLVPDEFTASLTPDMWAGPFDLSQLVNKRINVCDDLPPVKEVEAGKFKAVVNGEPVTINQKYQEQYTTRLKAGHIFCANHMPRSRDVTPSFFRRFLALDFQMRFDNNPTRTANLGKNIAEAERAAIVGWALDGFARLAENGGHYSEPQCSKVLIQKWGHELDNVQNFLHSITETATSDADWTHAHQLYTTYRNWCDNNGHRACSNTEFGKRLLREGKQRKRWSGGNMWGVKVVNNWRQL